MLSTVALILLAPPLRLEGGFLVDGKDRLNVAHPNRQQLDLGAAYTLRYYKPARGRADTVLVSKRGAKHLDFSAQIGKWLADETIWGAKRANDLRYTNSRMDGDRGIYANVSDAIKGPGNTAVCILDMRQAFASGVPGMFQLLVRLDPADPERPKLLRVLPGEGFVGTLGFHAGQRLIKWGGKDFIWLDKEFVHIKPGGDLGQDRIPWPGGTPAGQLTSRYLLVYQTNDAFEVFDLQTRKMHGVIRGFGFWVTPSTNSAWVRVDYSNQGRPTQYLIHAPDGRRHTPKGDIDIVWKNYAIDNTGDDLKVYAIPSGKLVARFEIPKP